MFPRPFGWRGGPPVDQAGWRLGYLESGVPHLAEWHREYIIESVKNG